MINLHQYDQHVMILIYILNNQFLVSKPIIKIQRLHGPDNIKIKFNILLLIANAKYLKTLYFTYFL